ncbi:hypothetical protein G6L37_06495 [Agrobacterium rubi]|nr:hypothetical protein [Agrobacterium rubi]NTF25012.1 hypothetical protein [Agrobacterium rubi]
MDASDEARKNVASFFAAATGRHDFKDYIENKLAGDFAVALADMMTARPESSTRQALDIAQRAIDDLRRYTYDNTADRRTKRAMHCQESLDALSKMVGISPRHNWPRENWISDEAQASLASIEGEGASLLSRIDMAYDSPMDPVVTGAVVAAKAFVQLALEDAREQRRSLSLMERELEMEEQESDHWARKATLDGDLGANPPTFLADVVADLRKELETVTAERDEHARVRESLRCSYNDLHDRVMELERRL